MSDPKAENPAPRHAFEVTLRAGANDWPEIVRIVNDLTIHHEQHGPVCELIQGSGYIKVETDPTMTEERYRKELQEWAERERRSK